MTVPFDMAGVRGLIKYLKIEVPEFNDILDEFPNHGDELEMPTASVITMGTPLYTNLMGNIWKTEQDPDEPLNDLVYERIAMLDLKLQVDIWAEYKIKRGEFVEKVKNAINKDRIQNDGPNGLSLILDDYHSSIARYDIVGYSYVNESIKSEWRAKIDLVVNYSEIVVKSIPRISELTIKDNITVEDWKDSNEEVKQIF